jgi:hypothetical protein
LQASVLYLTARFSAVPDVLFCIAVRNARRARPKLAEAV